MTLMTKRLLTLGVLVVAGGGAAYLAYWQTQRADEQEKIEDEMGKVLDVADVASIRQMTLTTPSGSVTVDREGTPDGKSVWMITAPLRTRADDTTIDALLENVANLKKTATVGEDKDGKKVSDAPLDLAMFGLAPARFTLTLVPAQGESKKLLVGVKSSFDDSLYVRAEGNDAVYVVPGSFEYQIDKQLYGLRDKRLVAFEETEVSGVAVSAAGQQLYSLERQGEGFRLVAPISTAADSFQVSTMLSALSSANAKSFVAEHATPELIKQYGLDTPRFEVVLTRAGSGKPERLLITSKAAGTGPGGGTAAAAGGEGPTYAMVAGDGNPIVELASNWMVEKLAVSAADLRDKHVLVFEREQVGRIVLAKGEQKIAFEKKSEGDNQSWTLTQPEQAKAQDAEVTSLLYRLWNLKAKRIVSESATEADKKAKGFTPPALTAELFKQDGTSLGVIAFGAVEADEQYITGGTRLDTVEKSAADEISLDPTSYKEVAASDK